MIFSGALERYLGMQFRPGECGAGWIPYVRERLDEVYEDQFLPLGFSMQPSESWRRQGYPTAPSALEGSLGWARACGDVRNARVSAAFS